jgi:hypothetical protein
MGDSLVDVMMDMLASDGRLNALGHLGCTLDASALELTSLLLKTSLDGSRVTVVVLTGFHRSHVVLVLFRKDFTVLNRLDGGVVVVLVNLAVNGFLHILVTRLYDLLLDDSGSNLLVHSGVYRRISSQFKYDLKSKLPYHGDQPCA